MNNCDYILLVFMCQSEKIELIVGDLVLPYYDESLNRYLNILSFITIITMLCTYFIL